MSGIYIPWMSMPETCDDCQVSADCPNDEHIDGYRMENRSRFCQLVPVPPHGRLGDLDELLDRAFGCLDEETFLVFQFLVNGSVTIIPAEEDK